MATKGKRLCTACKRIIGEGCSCRSSRVIERRGSAHERGYGVRWQRERLVYLRRHPLCIRCKAAGITTAATVIDHITPHRGDQQLFWDQGNWQPLCKSCHDKKTGRGE